MTRKFFKLLKSLNLTAARAEHPPMRLMLGKYAHAKGRKKCEDLTNELAAWNSLGWPTKFTF